MLKKLKKWLHLRSSNNKLGWSYVAITDKNGQSTGLAWISYRVRYFPFTFIKVKVSESIAESVCKDLNSKT